MDSFESGLVLGFMLGATVVYAIVWAILRETKGPIDQGRDWIEPDDNQLAVEDEREPRMFCLSCGATHYKQICPFCDSDAQDPL